MAYNASINAIKNAGIDSSNIDMIVVATTTPERKFPSTAVLLQNKLKNNKAFAFDLNAACTGFIYALDIADTYIKSGFANSALVVGTEKITSLLDWSDRNTCVLFGDGAGAVLLSSSRSPGILSNTIGSDGAYKDLLTVNTDREVIEMSGNDVFKIAVNTMGKLASETLEKNGMTIESVDWLIPHQANSRIINAVARKINLPDEKIVMTVKTHGNTSAASIPLALDYANSNNLIKEQDVIMFEAFGAGFTWGSTLLKY